MIDEEKAQEWFTPGSERGLPTEAAPPHYQAWDLGQLGTANADEAISMRCARRSIIEFHFRG